MWHCPRCGHDNPQEAECCLQCGARAGGRSLSRLPVRKKTLPFVLLLVAALAAIFGGLALLKRSAQPVAEQKRGLPACQGETARPPQLVKEEFQVAALGGPVRQRPNLKQVAPHPDRKSGAPGVMVEMWDIGDGKTRVFVYDYSQERKGFVQTEEYALVPSYGLIDVVEEVRPSGYITFGRVFPFFYHGVGVRWAKYHDAKIDLCSEAPKNYKVILYELGDYRVVWDPEEYGAFGNIPSAFRLVGPDFNAALSRYATYFELRCKPLIPSYINGHYPFFVWTTTGDDEKNWQKTDFVLNAFDLRTKKTYRVPVASVDGLWDDIRGYGLVVDDAGRIWIAYAEVTEYRQSTQFLSVYAFDEKSQMFKELVRQQVAFEQHADAFSDTSFYKCLVYVPGDDGVLAANAVLDQANPQVQEWQPRLCIDRYEFK